MVRRLALFSHSISISISYKKGRRQRQRILVQYIQYSGHNATRQPDDDGGVKHDALGESISYSNSENCYSNFIKLLQI